MNDIFSQNANAQIDVKDLAIPQASFSSGKYGNERLKVLYISDIHLGHHVYANRDNKLQIKRIVDELINETTIKAINQHAIVVFGGDIAVKTEFCQIFYHEFMIHWNYLLYKKWKSNHHYVKALSVADAEHRIENKTLELSNKKLKLVKKLRKWFRYDSRHEKQNTWEIIDSLNNKKNAPDYVPYYIKNIKQIEFSLCRLLDNRTIYIENMQLDCKYIMAKNLPVFAVLGNHELHAFDTVNEAIETYRTIFDKERIHFLHNQALSFDNYCIVGGVGFAKYNDKYNANTIIGAKTMSRFEEMSESNTFFTTYQRALNDMMDKQTPLIVLSHYPTKDWLPDNLCSSRCIYFTGHTHRNNSVHTERLHVYANNQIGYDKKHISFKQAHLGLCYNPFIDYKDGCYVITTLQYIQFYDYSGDSIGGTGLIDRQLDGGNSKFYMIKQQGFYGFFVVNQKTGTKICAGGRIKNISKVKDIEYFEKSFNAVVTQYATALLPYRQAQEQISDEIQQLGFDGRIHGCIIDVDFTNHIIINPLDGQITYYYSPVFGLVHSYDTFDELLLSMDSESQLEQKNQALTQYRKMKNDSENYMIVHSSSQLTTKLKNFVKIDIKNSVYAISNRINQLQCLFDSNILRDWNENFIQSVIDDTTLFLPR